MLIPLLGLTLTSCPDKPVDEPKEPDYADLIIGTWSDEPNEGWCEEGPGYAYGYEFKNNGVCYVHGSNYGPGRYQIFDDNLIVTFNDHWSGSRTEHFIITKLTKNVLVLQDTEYYDEEVYYRVK